MFPLGHAAVAYLGSVAVAAATRRPLPVHRALAPLAVGSQFPDLLDKPLAYYGVLVSGRSLGHSIFTAALVLVGVRWLSTRVAAPADGRLGWRLLGVVALGIAYAAARSTPRRSDPGDRTTPRRPTGAGGTLQLGRSSRGPREPASGLPLELPGDRHLAGWR